MLRARRVFFKMHAGDRHSFQTSLLYQRKFILADLVALRDIRIEIIFSIELGEIRELTRNRDTDLEHMLDRFFVYDRKGSRMCHAHGADIDVRALLVGVVLAGAEHLRLCPKLRMHFQTDCRKIVRHR